MSDLSVQVIRSHELCEFIGAACCADLPPVGREIAIKIIPQAPGGRML